MAQRRGRGAEMGVMLLAYQLMSFGIDRIPPVTLLSIGGMTAIYMGFVPMLDPYYNTYRHCMQVDRVLYRHEWHRMFYSILMHASDMHLYFNMISLLYKGARLERRIGSQSFAVLLVVLSAATSGMMVAVTVLLEETLGFKEFRMMSQCAVGFSGVLFALKVICGKLLHDDAYSHYLFGFIPVPGKYACWTELIAIQLMVPNASMLGHLAGILAGLLVLKTPMLGMITSIGGNDEYRPPPRGWNTGASRGTWDDRRYYEYTGGYTEEEQYARAQEESRRAYYQNAGYGWRESYR